jgi:class 3 adenylate cyclase
VLREAIAREDGALVKTIGDVVMAMVHRPVSALQAVLEAQRRLASSPAGTPLFYLKAGLHHGRCIVITMDSRLDCFASAVNMAARLERLSSGEGVVISDAIRNDPGVAGLLDNRLIVRRFESRLRCFDERFYLWRVERFPAAAHSPPAASGI